jgi:diacylglycerol kinase family enzyme
MSHLSQEEYSHMSCAFVILKGRPFECDVTKFDRKEKEPIYSFMSFAWGFIADVDIESEFLRCCCASARFDVYGFWRVLCLRRYPAVLTVKQPDNTEEEITEDTFLSVVAMNIPFLADNLHYSPPSQLADGANNLVVIKRDIGKCSFISSLFKQDDGTHLSMNRVHSTMTAHWSLDP